MQDTVGAVSLTINSTSENSIAVAAGVSRYCGGSDFLWFSFNTPGSGGILLKQSGRLGEVSPLYSSNGVSS